MEGAAATLLVDNTEPWNPLDAALGLASAMELRTATDGCTAMIGAPSDVLPGIGGDVDNATVRMLWTCRKWSTVLIK